MPRRKFRNKNNSSPRIMPFAAAVRWRHHFRFYSAVGNITTFNITRANLLNLLFVGAGSTNAHRIIAGIKLNRIECFLPPMANGTVTTVSLEWRSNYGPTSEVSDSTSSLAQAACIKTSPPRQSLASFWSMTGSNESEVLFRISATQNASAGSQNLIIDCWVDIVMMDDDTPVTLTTNSTTTAAQLYAGFLDGQGSGAVLTPVSLTSIS